MRVLINNYVVEAEQIQNIDNRILIYGANHSFIIELGIRSEKVAGIVFGVIKSSLFSADAVSVDDILAIRVPNKDDYQVSRIK